MRLRIAWGDPYATQYLVQYWTGEEAIKQPTKGAWVPFPGGVIANGNGGTVTLPLTSSPMVVRFVRIWMSESSNTCDSHGSADPRNCVGYAIREVSIGTSESERIPRPDATTHRPGPDHNFCSSIDPWHELSDLGSKQDEQVGLDLFTTAGTHADFPQ